MDMGTVGGLAFTYGVILLAMATGVGIEPYVDVASVLIVFGGSIGAILIAFRLEQVKQMGGFFMIAVKPPKIDMHSLIEKMIGFAVTARKEGILSLEGPLKNEDNLFLQNGLILALLKSS